MAGNPGGVRNRTRAVYFDVDKLRRALAVKHQLAGEVPAIPATAAWKPSNSDAAGLRFPAAPLAISINVWLVDMSPSTVIAFKLRGAD